MTANSDCLLSLSPVQRSLSLRVQRWLARYELPGIVGVIVVVAVVLITYQPALEIGFWFDDFNHLQAAGSQLWSEFWVALSPAGAHKFFVFYRPIQQIQWRIEYILFGGNAFWYHWAQHLIHLSDFVLLYALIARLSRSWRAGFIGALLYAVLSTDSIAVFWLGVPDPLAAFFCLISVWMWVEYLTNGSWARYGLTLGAFIWALLTKEISLTLPIVLVLVDRWLVKKPTKRHHCILQYIPFFLLLALWFLFKWSEIGYILSRESSGTNWATVASNMIDYYGALAFPWSIEPAVRYLALLVALTLFLYAFATHKSRLLLLGVVGLVSTIPLANSLGTAARNLYVPMLVSAAAVGTIADRSIRFISMHLSNRSIVSLAWLGTVSLVLVFITMHESLATAQAATGFAGLAHETRLQFKPIYQRHAAFEPNTLLYFINPPISTYVIAGMMFLRYGADVIVEGNDYVGLAGLGNHRAAYVFYQDDDSIWREQPVERGAVASTNYKLPIQFGSSFSLDGFELVNTTAKSGEAIVVILYWRALEKVDENYTVFVHLLDVKGAIIDSYDSQPHRGALPTTRWEPRIMVEDAIILPIDRDVPPGQNYRLEVGWYYLPTMQRLSIIDQNGQPLDDKIVIQPFSIVQ